MKKLLLALSVVAAFASCKKDGETTTTPQAVNWKHFIPNWQKDSLEVENPPDSIFADVSNDTTYIIYEGVRYYIWTQNADTSDTVRLAPITKIHPNRPFENNQQWYPNCYIGKNLFDTATAFNCMVWPAKYYDDNSKTWVNQNQQLMLPSNPPPYPIKVGGIYDHRTWYLNHNH